MQRACVIAPATLHIVTSMPARALRHRVLTAAQLGFEQYANIGALCKWVRRVAHLGDVSHTGGYIAKRMRMAEEWESSRGLQQGPAMRGEESARDALQMPSDG